jgi:hypothetical protein
MKRLALTACLALFSLNAAAVGRAADVTIVDRDSGRALPTYFYRGEYWVAGTPGNRYSIQLHNRIGGRVLAVMAVDGVNVVSGETAGWDQTGYVFGPNQSYDITGWRKSNAEVAAFEFATAPNSYAARTGRTANIGVIGVAIFRERVEPPVAILAPRPPSPTDSAAANESRLAAAAPSAQASAGAEARQKQNLAESARMEPSLGTGHGQRESSYVQNTEFTRRQSTPDEVIRIRYDSHDNLVALGVIRQAPPSGISPNPFPESPAQGFVPDPPGYSGRGLR